MTKEIVYTSNKRFEEILKRGYLVPYRVNPRIKYETKKSYYSDYWNMQFQVLQVNYTEDDVLDNAYIKWEDGNYGLICTDLDYRDLKLCRDTKDLKNTNIINSDKYYTGAEIVYWFYIHNINCLNMTYKGFWRYVDATSAHRLADNTKYKICGVWNGSKYINCKIIKHQKSS